MTYNVAILGSIGVNPGYVLVNNKDYPDIADDYVKSFKALRSLPVDVFLGAHGSFYGLTDEVRRSWRREAPNPFIDPAGFKAHLDRQEKNFTARLDEQKKAARNDDAPGLWNGHRLVRLSPARQARSRARSSGAGSRPSELCDLSAIELAARLKKRDVSARDVMAAHLARIERVNPKVNAVVTLVAERAMADAARADEALARRGPIGPLHGLPVAHKDLVDTAGIRTTRGSPFYRDHVPTT